MESTCNQTPVSDRGKYAFVVISGLLGLVFFKHLVTRQSEVSQMHNFLLILVLIPVFFLLTKRNLP